MNGPVIRYFLVRVVLLISIAASSPILASNLFDVSYLWHRDLARVFDYRERIARVLGSDVSKDLKVVSKAKLFGVIYLRHGNGAVANRIAKSHSQVLRSQGLEEAAPVRSIDWTVVEQKGDSKTPAGVHARPNLFQRAEGRTTGQREINSIEKAVESYIKGLRKKGKIAPDERTGWSVYDFTTGEKLVTINESVQFQAASLVKPFIAAAFFHKVEHGDFIYGEKTRRHMERMIQRSNNPSSNWITRKLGGPEAVERILKRHYPGIFRQTRIVEYIPANGRTYRNKASIHDYSRFLYALWTETIPGAREIKRLMALPGPDRIYTGTRKLPQETTVLNKTGSTARVCADMGILVVKGQNNKHYPYTLIGIIEKRQGAPNYTDWIRARSNIIRNVSSIVYTGIARYHNLNAVLSAISVK